MQKHEIEYKIREWETKRDQYKTYLSNNSSYITSEDIERVQTHITTCENEIKKLERELKYVDINPQKDYEEEVIIKNNHVHESSNPAIQARYDARKRFYAMNKVQQTIAKLNGQHKKFMNLWNKATKLLSEEEEQKIASELGKMFR